MRLVGVVGAKEHIRGTTYIMKMNHREINAEENLNIREK
jgi:hypothetical protein